MTVTVTAALDWMTGRLTLCMTTPARHGTNSQQVETPTGSQSGRPTLSTICTRNQRLVVLLYAVTARPLVLELHPHHRENQAMETIATVDQLGRHLPPGIQLTLVLLVAPPRSQQVTAVASLTVTMTLVTVTMVTVTTEHRGQHSPLQQPQLPLVNDMRHHLAGLTTAVNTGGPLYHQRHIPH